MQTQAILATLNQLTAALSEELLIQKSGLTLDEVLTAVNYATHVVSQHEEQVKIETTLAATSTKIKNIDLNKVLVVDDIPENRFLIQYMFKGSGFTLSLAANAREALEKARTELPVLIVSDIQMPSMSGLEMLVALKSDEVTRDIGVILVTAHHRDSKEVSEGLTLGADDYIKRPFARDEFLSRVGAVVRIKRAEAEAKQQARMVAQRNKGLQLVNELALAVNSSLDLQEILTSSIQKLSVWLDAEMICLLLLTGQSELMVKFSINSAEFTPINLGSKSNAEMRQAILTHQIPVLIQQTLQQYQQEWGVKSIPLPEIIESVPMMSREQVWGALAIVSKSGQPLDETDWRLIHSAVAIISTAVENIHLLESTQQQVDDLIGLNNIWQSLISTLDLDEILQKTTTLVQNSLQSEVASFWLRAESGQDLVLTVSSGQGTEALKGFQLPFGQGVLGRVLDTAEVYLPSELTESDAYLAHLAQHLHYQPSSMLCIPIRSKRQIIGVMQVLHREQTQFNQIHLRLAYPVANSIGIAIENARLFSEVQNFNRQLEEMVMARTQELADEKERTEAILVSIADGLLVLDADNRIFMANQTAEYLLRFKMAELVGQPIQTSYLQHPLWRCIHDIAHDSRLSVSVMVDVPLESSDAGLSIQAHSAKVKNEQGQIIGTVIVLSDLTALKEVEQMKARFIAGVTHELKTPLSIIKLHSQNLLSFHDRLPPQKRVELLTSIQSQVKLLGRLVEDILELSRFDGGMIETNYQPLDIVLLMDEVIEELNPLADSKQIELNWQKPIQAMSVSGDVTQLKRVATNLVENAIKYTLAGGNIQVRMALELTNGRGFVIIQVEDTGIGISVEHQSKVFERFHRVDFSHTIPGTGLGLAIVKEILQAHGGRVELRSTPNVGSVFTAKLPALLS